jgi:hypothetical protein
MIKGALYKKHTDENNHYGYDFVKVLDVRVSRTVEWTPTSDRNDEQYAHFWRQLPNGDIHKITNTDYDIVLYWYNTEKRKNEVFKHIATVDEEEFMEGISMCYDLVSIDGESQ